MRAVEVNFDGLIGPTHNYAGLSDGNLASAANAGDISSPRRAALQGLEKMRHLLRLGLVQAVLPPLPRPCLDFLFAAGFSGTDRNMIETAARQAPQLLKMAYSASSMWSANAATVSPSADSADGRVHVTPANLSTMFHRSLEHPDMTALLLSIFPQADFFALHSALPSHPSFSDEGAANHVRLCNTHADAGVQMFVYGHDGGGGQGRFPARQSRLASEAIARMHLLEPSRTVLVRQSRRAIEAGAFHNDVVCVGTLGTLFFHEAAFEDLAGTLDALQRAADGLFDLRPVMVSEAEVPLDEAVSSYLFNSQLLQVPGERRLLLLAPVEVQENDSTRRYCERLVRDGGPIGRVEFADVRESMRNGGGPACLRLRVVLNAAEMEACHEGVFLTEEKIDTLAAIVSRTYRDRLQVEDLADPDFADECRLAREQILAALSLESLG